MLKSRFAKMFLDFRKIKQRKNQGEFAIEKMKLKYIKREYDEKNVCTLSA